MRRAAVILITSGLLIGALPACSPKDATPELLGLEEHGCC